MTATNRPDIAGSASSRFGIIETNAIRATDSAAKTALRAILDVFSFPVSYQSSAAGDKVAAHALAAAVGAEQTGADIAGAAAVRRFAGAAEAAVLRRVEILLCRRIFAVVGIHSARAVKILGCIVEPAASLLSRALEVIPLRGAILLGNSVEQNEGILYPAAAYFSRISDRSDVLFAYDEEREDDEEEPPSPPRSITI